MFGVTKERLLQGLSGARQRSCCYIGDTCDCKYGIEESKDNPLKFDPFKYTSEQTGCPEIRVALAVIKGLPEETYNELCAKAGISII